MTENTLEPKTETDCVKAGNLARAVILLQEKWILFIVYGLLDGPLGFNELSRRARGVNTTTLSQRMDLLEKNGIVIKTVYSTIPPRTSYELTEAGMGLKTVIKAIIKWSDEFLPKTDEVTSCEE